METKSPARGVNWEDERPTSNLFETSERPSYFGVGRTSSQVSGGAGGSPTHLVPRGEALARGLIRHCASGAEKATVSAQHIRQGSHALAKKDGEAPQFQATGREEGEGVQREWRVAQPYVTSSPSPLALWKGAGYDTAPRLLGQGWLSIPLPSHPQNPCSPATTPPTCLLLFGVSVNPSHLYFPGHLVLTTG